MKILVFVVALLVLIGCTRTQDTEKLAIHPPEPMPSQITSILFCPKDSESEARKVLHLDEIKKFSEEEILKIFNTYGISYEQSDVMPHRCDDATLPANTHSYQIHAGFGAEKSHAKNFLLVFNAQNDLLIIENRYQYQPPKLWSD